jgi:hypothetical protein
MEKYNLIKSLFVEKKKYSDLQYQHMDFRKSVKEANEDMQRIGGGETGPLIF